MVTQPSHALPARNGKVLHADSNIMKEAKGWVARDGKFFETEDECRNYELSVGRQKRIDAICSFLDSHQLQSATRAAFIASDHGSEPWAFGRELRRLLDVEFSSLATMIEIYVTKDERLLEAQSSANSSTPRLDRLCELCIEFGDLALDDPEEILANGRDLLANIVRALDDAIEESKQTSECK